MAIYKPVTGISFLDNLLSRFSTGKPQVESNPFNPYIVGQPAIYPDPNAENFIKLAFSGNGSVFTIVDTAARKFGYLPRYVYQINKKATKELRRYHYLQKHAPTRLHEIKELMVKAYGATEVENDFEALMKRPNPTQGQDSFFKLLYVYYKIVGEAFIYLNRGDTKGLTDEAAAKVKPLEMWVLPAQYVILRSDPEDINGVIGYYLKTGGQDLPIRKTDIIHWRNPNPNFDAITKTHLRGFSPLLAGNKIATQDDSSTDAAVAMHQNDGAKAIIFQKTIRELTATQESQLRNVIDRKINNRSTKGSVAVLQGDWGSIDLSMSSVDMQLMEGQDKAFIKLCNLFGVPPEVFLPQVTYHNKDMARRDLITNLLLPDACSLRDEMNRVLLPAFGLNPAEYTHDIDITDLSELQDDMNKKVESLTAAFWLTPNQRLEAMNKERSEEPGMDDIWVPNNLVKMEDAIMTDELESFQQNDPTGKTPSNSSGKVPNRNSDNARNQEGLSDGSPAKTVPKKTGD